MEFIQEGDRSKWKAHSNHSNKFFTKGDIDRMTNSYRTSLGRGAFGEVYEGVLEDGSMVAVKRFIHNVKENFAKELIVHREINHKNVVRLIGCCEEENALMLVTEYVANGNLSNVLHDDNLPIPLDVRLRIAIECAEALAYMHSHMYTQVIHGDVKPGNILLDSNFHAKLSDFGISRLANTDKTLHTKNVIGSIGYMDPLFALDGLLTVKYDVYSFGVVLLELMTRKKATTVVDNVNVVYAFTSALARGSGGVRWMFDTEIASKNNMKVVEGVAKIAGDCLTMEREKRPEMIDVVERLRVLRQKASRQDQASQRSGLFSWARKNKTTPPASANILANILPSESSKVTDARPHSQNSNGHGLPQLENRRFTYKELEFITNNFIRVLGRGGFGYVYDGFLEDGTQVAVKLRSESSNQGVREFLTEAQTLTKIHHKNLVSLIGYCKDGEYLALVYEYMSQGTLEKKLRGKHDKAASLTWRQRLRIALDSAQGLEYLHHACSPAFVHRDVKTSNILLNGNLGAKIADFGLLKDFRREDDTHVSTDRVVGTHGYLAPEYASALQLTAKSDVYSFGVVLLEVITGQPPIQRCPEPTSVVQWVRQRLARGNIEDVVDAGLLRGGYDINAAWKVADVALMCTAQAPAQRPTMADVVWQLQECLRLEL